MMRTTVNLPDDLYEVVRSLAEAKRISLGEAMAELLRKGLHPRANLDSQTAFPRFFVEPGAPPITLDQTLQAEDEP
jgi:hypothetical protein